MVNVSVTDILKIHHDWIESTAFVSLVSQKLRVSDRQAYRLIKKESGILKSLIPNSRAVIYGLPEFGPPVKTEVIEKVIMPSKLGFWGFLHKRAELHHLESEQEDRRRDEVIKELDADIEAIKRRSRLEQQRAERNFRRVLLRRA